MVGRARACAIAVMLVAMFAAATGAAHAQIVAPPPTAPNQISTSPQSRIQTLVDSAWLLSGAVNRVARARLAPAGPRPAAAAFAAVQGFGHDVGNAAPIGPALAFDSGQMPEPASQPQWQAWADAQASNSDFNNAVTGFDGTVRTWSAGIDRRLGARGLGGLLVSYETSDFESGLGLARTDSEGVGAGAYAAIALSEAIVADALVMWHHFDNDIRDPFATGSFDSDRLFGAVNVTGYWYAGAWRFSPGVNFSWSREWQDGFRDSLGSFSPRQTVKTATLSGGVQVGYRLGEAEGMTAEPWVGLKGDWYVQSSDEAGVPPGGDEPDEFDMRVELGLLLRPAHQVAVTLRGEVNGLARDHYTGVAGGAQVAVQF